MVRGAAGLPFLLYSGLTLAVVPPVLDAPRRLTLTSFEERAENEVLAFFKEVNSLDEAEVLAGCSLLVRETDVDMSVLEQATDLSLWEGFEVYDACLGRVGEIIDIDDRALQPLLTVKTEEGREVLIPLAEELIEDINEEARAVYMTLPEGLLDL